MQYVPDNTLRTRIDGFLVPYPDKRKRNMIVTHAEKMSTLDRPGKKSSRHVSNRSAKEYRSANARSMLLGNKSRSSKPLPRTLKRKDGTVLVRSGRQSMKAKNRKQLRSKTTRNSSKTTRNSSKTPRNSSMNPPTLRRTQERLFSVVKE
jgi:hypothetical protein